MFSAFNPSKCTHLEQWAADCAAPGEQSWTSCRSRDLNPQPWVSSGFKSNALSIRPTTALFCCHSQPCLCHSSNTGGILSNKLDGSRHEKFTFTASDSSDKFRLVTAERENWSDYKLITSHHCYCLESFQHLKTK